MQMAGGMPQLTLYFLFQGSSYNRRFALISLCGAAMKTGLINGLTRLWVHICGVYRYGYSTGLN